MRSSICLGLILAATIAFSSCAPSRKPGAARSLAPTIDGLAPEIDGEDLDGKYFKLSSYKGKVVLLDFWGMWCGYCVKFLPHSKNLVEKYKDRPFVALGVNTDGDPSLPKSSKNLAMRCWADGEGAISKRWGITGFPTLYVIDHEGVIRRAFEGMGPSDVIALDTAIEELVRKAEEKKLAKVQ